MKIKIVNKSKNPIPSYTHDGDACVDLRANFSVEDILSYGHIPTNKVWWHSRAQMLIIDPGQTALIHTGLYADFDEGELQVRSRSGLAIKHGVCVWNAPGTIDKNYKGEICVILYNGGKDPFEIRQGDRIAQMIWCPVEPMEFEEVTELSESERGEKGFGSSGVK